LFAGHVPYAGHNSPQKTSEDTFENLISKLSLAEISMGLSFPVRCGHEKKTANGLLPYLSDLPTFRKYSYSNTSVFVFVAISRIHPCVLYVSQGLPAASNLIQSKLPGMPFSFILDHACLLH
jgi:hypothetical protein